MFVCLFVLPILTQNLRTNLPQILIGELGRDSEMLLLGFEILSWVGRLLSGKIAKIVIYDQVRVNCGSNHEYPG